MGAEVGGGASVGGLVRLAEQGVLDFVTVAGGEEGGGGRRSDPVGLLARAAAETSWIGLVPTVTVTRAEPFHVQAAVATLDRVSRGRAGWSVAVSASESGAALFGREPAPSADALWREAGEVVDVSTRLWDSWEEDTGPGDSSTGRFVDPDKVHHVDFAGEFLSVKGSASVPRPPQGWPVTVVDVSVCGPDGLAVAARYADVVIVRAFSPGEAGVMRADLRRRAATAGRDPDSLRILAALTVDLAGEPHLDGPPLAETDAVRMRQDGAAGYTGGPVGLAQVLTQWHAADVVDGFHLTPLSPERDLERLVNGTATLLQHRCLQRNFYAGATLRDHLGLARPVSRYARSGAGRRS
ncbi:LLM class flavin-dependent oxidoreductase [Streptomyces sp. NPDC021093]|uniref:LLM class flavin-dependent oxidoreductase n=1 Tax=Streptomyces sp. NPDC021093 TaxID=3365112 RepID=UPI0037898148